MKYKCFVSLFIIFLIISQSLSLAETPPHEIIEKVKVSFLKIKDASMDITLDYNIHIFGCTGVNRLKGKAYYKAPDKIKIELDNNVTYFAKGNIIRKIDEKGRKFYVKLLNSLNFGVGFHPGLISDNFYLTLIEDKAEQIIIQGIPKPETLKNTKKVLFYIDPKEELLRGINVTFKNEKLPGKIKIDYIKTDDIWVPHSFQGESAVTLYQGIQAGMTIKLKSDNLKINNGLSDNLFNPNF